MGFYKNAGVSLSPLYAKFLNAKKKLKLPDGTTILNIIAVNLYMQGFIKRTEYEMIKEAYGVNWGTMWGTAAFYAHREANLQTGKYVLYLGRVNSSYNIRLMKDFLKAMDVPQINAYFNQKPLPIFDRFAGTSQPVYAIQNMDEYHIVDTIHTFEGMGNPYCFQL